MRPEDILFWLKAVPFKPFRICLNSGRTYEIRHPEMLRVSRTTMLVFSFAGEPQDPIGKMEMVGLVLVERIEPIEAPTHARGFSARSRADRSSCSTIASGSAFSPRKVSITFRIRARTFL